jgi:uroporphyrinogen-III decarboxylase
MGEGRVLPGNFDPVRVLRNGSVKAVRDAVAECHRQVGARFIVGAGCEASRDTPAENMRALSEYAQEAVP